MFARDIWCTWTEDEVCVKEFKHKLRPYDLYRKLFENLITFTAATEPPPSGHYWDDEATELIELLTNMKMSADPSQAIRKIKEVLISSSSGAKTAKSLYDLSVFASTAKGGCAADLERD